MQDQNDLEPVTSTTVLGESDQYSLSERLDVNVVDQRYSTESLIQEDIDNKENMSPFNYEHGVNENLDQVIFGQSGFLGQANRSEEGAELEEDFIEDAEVRTTPVEAIENTTMQPSKYQQIEPAKPYNSLLLVQEFHTGLTSCDDSGESGEEGDDCKEEGEESDDDDDDEDDNNDSDDCSDIDDDIGEEEEYEDRHKQSIRTPSEAMQPILQSPPLSRTIDYEFIALKAFRPDPTPEEIVERRKNLEKYGLMFSRDEYTYYMENRIVNPPEDEEYYKEVQDVVASITEKERNWRIDADSKRKQGEELNVVAKRKRSVSPAAPNPPVEPDFGTMDHNTVELVGLELSSVTDAISSLNSVNVETSAPHLTNVLAPAVSTKPLKKPNPPSAVLDAVLTNILRESQSAQKLKIGESSDLEAAAMAAGLILNDTDGTTTKRGPQSRLSKQEHAEFLKCNEMLKNGRELTLQERAKFDRLSALVKAEKEQFLKYQCRSAIQSGVYDTLDPKVEKLIKEFYELEKKRVHAYPQFYKYFNIVEMSPDATNEAPILAFKKCLFTQGQIAPCNSKMYDTPRSMNLFRKYLVSNTNSPDEEQEHLQYYKKKLLPAIVVDPIIPNLIKDTRPDVVISSECLTAIVEMIHSISSEVCIPISVMNTGANKKVLVMDQPFPKDSLTTRAKNKLVYDLAFKSLCLDWKKKHPISANQSRPPSPNNYGAAATAAAPNEDWDMESDENLQYNLWSFGDMNIIIRHQADGELVAAAGSKERRVCLTTKLDYQIQPDGFEEILTPSERASQWIQSYIGGHALVLEGRVDVLKNRLVRVDQKQMKDIMSDNWKPSYESEMLRHTFLRLHKMLVPGNYLLQHKAGDRNFLIYQGTDSLENTSAGIDLYSKYGSSMLPTTSNPELAFIPAWNIKASLTDQIPWTFPTSS